MQNVAMTFWRENKCRVLPPKKVYHPVLPYKSNSKIMFLLCSACADTTNQFKSTHYDVGRCMFGKYFMDESRKAIEIGYGLVNLIEFWEYEVTCFDRGANSGGLFAEYVNMFLKL